MLVPPMGNSWPYPEVFPLPSQNANIAPVSLHAFAYIVRGALTNWWADRAVTHPSEG